MVLVEIGRDGGKKFLPFFWFGFQQNFNNKFCSKCDNFIIILNREFKIHTGIFENIKSSLIKNVKGIRLKYLDQSKRQLDQQVPATPFASHGTQNTKEPTFFKTSANIHLLIFTHLRLLQHPANSSFLVQLQQNSEIVLPQARPGNKQKKTFSLKL